MWWLLVPVILVALAAYLLIRTRPRDQHERVGAWFLAVASVCCVAAIPGLAWIPFAILWFGLGQGAVLFIIVMSIFFPVLHNLLTGIRMVQPVLIEAVQTLGAGRAAVIRHVIFPATLPNLMTGIRLGIAFGFRSLVGGEMIASTDGLGYAIFNAQQYFQSARIVVGMLTIGIVWLAMDRLILRPIEQRTTMRWGLIRDGLEKS